MEQLALFALPIAKNREDEAMDSEEEHSDSVDDEVTLLSNPFTGQEVEEEKSPSKSTDKEDSQSERPVTFASVPVFPSNPGHSIFFINGDGINRDVITTDICRYLGNGTLIKPGAFEVNHAH